MDALTLVEAGLIQRLVVEMPPRHGKTELCSVQFPAWALGRTPSARIILASYAQQLAVLNSRRIRDTLSSEVYQKAFPLVQIREDKASEKEWETTQRGGAVAAGVGTGLTGRGANYLIIDDPVKDREEARSAVTLKNIEEWYSTVARTRLQPGGAIIFVMTRWSPQDLVGVVLEHATKHEAAMPVYRLRLPAVAEEADPLGRDVGEALWDEYPLEVLNDIQSLDPINFDALFQQNPQSEHAIRFSREDIGLADSPPAGAVVCRSWDLAITDDEDSDYAVGALVYGKPLEVSQEARQTLLETGLGIPFCLHVADLARQQAQYPEQRRLIVQTAIRDGLDIPIVIEWTRMELAAIQQLKQDLEGLGFTVHTVKPKGDKVARKAQLQVDVQLRQMTFAPAHWNEDAWVEFENFPVHEHDDIVDSIEQARLWLSMGDWDWEFI